MRGAGEGQIGAGERRGRVDQVKRSLQTGGPQLPLHRGAYIEQQGPPRHGGELADLLGVDETVTDPAVHRNKALLALAQGGWVQL